MVVHTNGMRYATSGKHAWWTTTWERADKRQDSRLIEDVARNAEFHTKITESNKKDFNNQNAIFNKIVDRVKKQHPEMNTIKARNYARKKDPVGRKFQRLKDSGYSANEISKRLFGRKGRASTERSSG